MNTLFEFSRKRINEVPTDFIRYMYNRIKWQGRMLGLVGPRGVGKTTLLLQYARQQLDPADTLYISTDQMYFASHSLLEVADRFNKAGGKHLLIDEIHKYPDWSRVLKSGSSGRYLFTRWVVTFNTLKKRGLYSNATSMPRGSGPSRWTIL